MRRRILGIPNLQIRSSRHNLAGIIFLGPSSSCCESHNLTKLSGRLVRLAIRLGFGFGFHKEGKGRVIYVYLRN